MGRFLKLGLQSFGVKGKASRGDSPTPALRTAHQGNSTVQWYTGFRQEFLQAA